jgi:hypothetical protein
VPDRDAPAGRGGRRPDLRTRILGLVSGVALVALVVAALFVIGAREDAPAELETPATPDPTEVPTGLPVEPVPTPTDLGTETPPPPERDPEPADVAAFTARYAPDGARVVELLTADLDDDGAEDIVIASLAGSDLVVELAAWDGRAYGIVTSERLAAADELDAFVLRDVTADGAREVVVAFTGPDGSRLALWRRAEEGLERLVTRGGCADGGRVHRAAVDDVTRGRLVVTCPPGDDGSQTGRAEHVWAGDAWQAIEPDEPNEEPT